MPDGQQIDPQLMALMQQGGAGAAGPGAQMPPVSSPMSTPQPAEGDKQGGMVQVQMAMDLLEQTLPMFGSDSEEGKAILSALTGMSKKFSSNREKGRELIPSEIKNLVASLPQSAGGAGGAGAAGAPPGAAPGMPPGMPPQGAMPQPMAA